MVLRSHADLVGAPSIDEVSAKELIHDKFVLTSRLIVGEAFRANGWQSGDEDGKQPRILRLRLRMTGRSDSPIAFQFT